MRTFDVLVALFALYMLARHGRQGLLFLAPGLVRAEAHHELAPASLSELRAGDALAELGFLRLGVLVERGVLGGLSRTIDAWAHPGEGVYADVVAGAPRGGTWLELRSSFADGAAVVTANHPRLAISTRSVQAGALPGAGLAALLAAHCHATERFAREHGAPQALPDLEARLRVARAWQRGPGRRELRHRFALRFANACLALLLLAGSVNLLLNHVK
jgi:hypothetical protein